jgi:hypothetical protein
LWWNQGCSIGCAECATDIIGPHGSAGGAGAHPDKIGFSKRFCNASYNSGGPAPMMNSTLPREAWTMNVHAIEGVEEDAYRFNPWRAREQSARPAAVFLPPHAMRHRWPLTSENSLARLCANIMLQRDTPLSWMRAAWPAARGLSRALAATHLVGVPVISQFTLYRNRSVSALCCRHHDPAGNHGRPGQQGPQAIGE